MNGKERGDTAAEGTVAAMTIRRLAGAALLLLCFGTPVDADERWMRFSLYPNFLSLFRNFGYIQSTSAEFEYGPRRHWGVFGGLGYDFAEPDILREFDSKFFASAGARYYFNDGTPYDFYLSLYPFYNCYFYGINDQWSVFRWNAAVEIGEDYRILGPLGWGWYALIDFIEIGTPDYAHFIALGIRLSLTLGEGAR